MERNVPLEVLAELPNQDWFQRLSPERQAEVMREERQRQVDIEDHLRAEAARPCCWCRRTDCPNKHNC
ncbi:MAG TPA: hypothetical protein VLF21_02520 [Candidatus Saccharimonadales bacterium]|nr:hypothetical protein [Candidatus Saccharimonadales bacterium]